MFYVIYYNINMLYKITNRKGDGDESKGTVGCH
jgi:hypothetical protein